MFTGLGEVISKRKQSSSSVDFSFPMNSKNAILKLKYLPAWNLKSESIIILLVVSPFVFFFILSSHAFAKLDPDVLDP